MGIKGLPDFLKRKAAGAFEALPTMAHIIDAIQKQPLCKSGRRSVAVDTPSLFYRIMYSAEDAHAGAATFMGLFEPLRDADIGVLFVFDGQHKPHKAAEHERRAARRAADTKNLAALQQALVEAESGPTADVADVGAWLAETETYRKRIASIEKRQDVVRPYDYLILRAALTQAGWPVLEAHDEGEKGCTWLTAHGWACAVISDDFDCLPFGAPVFIRNFGAHRFPCQAVYASRVLAALGMTHDMFLQFCVLCGSDFTDHLPGMGPAKAFKTMRVYKSIQEYLVSEQFVKEYATRSFNAEQALAMFRDATPPHVTLEMAVAIVMLAVLPYTLRRDTKRKRDEIQSRTE